MKKKKKEGEGEEQFIFYEVETPPTQFPSWIRSLLFFVVIIVVIGFGVLGLKKLKVKPLPFASFLIDSVPQGAVVYLDDIERGVTPLYISEIIPDTYKVKIVKEGFSPIEERVSVVEGRENKFVANLLDVSPPKIFAFLPPEFRADAPLSVSAHITDNVDVKEVYFYYKREGEEEFKKILMNRDEKGFSATIKREDVRPPFLLWYITASDESNTSRFPEAGYNRVQIIPRIGSLFISSNPEGATVFIDGREVGTTPCTITRLEAGTHNILLKKSQYEPYRTKVTVVEGQTQHVVCHLKILPATLLLKSKPEKAYISFNGEEIGSTPKRLSPLSPHKEYEILLRAPGYRTKSVRISLKPGEEKEMNVELERIYGKVYITSIPAEAAIYVDEKFLGYTPIREASIGVGEVTIKALKDGYKDMEKRVEIKEGEITFVNFTLIPQ